MVTGLAIVLSGCFAESIQHGGACTFEPASISTTSSSKITERSRHAVGRCAGSSRSPQPRPPLRGLSSRTASANGSSSVSPRIDGSHPSFVASGTRRSWSNQRARTETAPFPFSDAEFSTRVCNATISSMCRSGQVCLPWALRDPRRGGRSGGSLGFERCAFRSRCAWEACRCVRVNKYWLPRQSATPRVSGSRSPQPFRSRSARDHRVSGTRADS
jgi:hypothetical protein